MIIPKEYMCKCGCIIKETNMKDNKLVCPSCGKLLLERIV